MTVQLTKEQTEFWNRRMKYQFALMVCIGIGALMLMPILGMLPIIFLVGGLIGIILFVSTMYSIKFYVEPKE